MEKNYRIVFFLDREVPRNDSFMMDLLKLVGKSLDLSMKNDLAKNNGVMVPFQPDLLDIEFFNGGEEYLRISGNRIEFSCLKENIIKTSEKIFKLLNNAYLEIIRIGLICNMYDQKSNNYHEILGLDYLKEKNEINFTTNQIITLNEVNFNKNIAFFIRGIKGSEIREGSFINYDLNTLANENTPKKIEILQIMFDFFKDNIFEKSIKEIIEG